MAAKKKQSTTSSDSKPEPDEPASFEQALEALEDLVAEMEGDDLPLEKMIVGYEKGVRLRGICEKRLEEAQAKVQLIRDQGASGETGGAPAAALEDFDPANRGADDAAGANDRSGAAQEAKSVTEESDGELF